MGRVMVTVGIKGVSVSKPARIPTPGSLYSPPCPYTICGHIPARGGHKDNRGAEGLLSSEGVADSIECPPTSHMVLPDLESRTQDISENRIKPEADLRVLGLYTQELLAP
jgi:hypothetical protein